MVRPMSDVISLSAGAMRATLSTIGARLLSLSYSGTSVILSADPDKHEGWYDVYPGALIGPLANRVRGGRVPIGDALHQMACNEGGITALHSGPAGLDVLPWQVVQQTDHNVHMRHTLADGDMGLPGDREVNVIFTLEDTALTLDIRATTTAPTPISIAHHPYWRLGDAQDHLLQINADNYLPTDDTNVPTGTVVPVEGTPFDHRAPRQMHRDTDHNFCTGDSQLIQPEQVATLTGSDGLRLQIDTTEPGLQVYSGAHLPDLPGTDVAPLAGIALEPQGWPDAPNNPDFPSVITTPDRPYHQITRYRFDRAT